MESSSNSVTQDGQLNRLAVQKMKTCEERRYRMKMLKVAMIAAVYWPFDHRLCTLRQMCWSQRDHPHTSQQQQSKEGQKDRQSEEGQKDRQSEEG